ncbi:hypothetical protein BATDEDRAFT_18967 [Batrachochytrium dendrobatidis JAM81]|uniref:Selenoprotein O n=1 Tax=Batrachochytrium dendrobatidis (strain JAM81 / FGSC 10211) TaxID=684364 RepID=F4NYS9_BATDJ|nr:uncharacterized protein BATDEDRAFT_18967 [Batrachochytrium dendrobatidis JAM81]EGF82082.1 hypothetical protein BATDEDRAFT_18967 [Batrachochytrium dendrobatidis JAM81]|eukprot:XP_006677195.1 hypothetical protein BATDEDRAFT_18967 [Batrachochytrium dendrobatidis JAM81]
MDSNGVIKQPLTDYKDIVFLNTFIEQLSPQKLAIQQSQKTNGTQSISTANAFSRPVSDDAWNQGFNGGNLAERGNLQQGTLSQHHHSQADRSSALVKEFYAFHKPFTHQPHPRLLITSVQSAALLCCDIVSLKSPSSLSYLTGTRLHSTAIPYAQNYGGHQYGMYAGQLGDGRCVSIGEVMDNHGERWTLQIKGCGTTQFSRTGDGHLSLRACLREFMVSEYMAAIGIPTTRCLAVVSTSRLLQPESAGILTRFAPTWIRFGSFELFHFRNDHHRVRELADYCIRTYYPEAESDAESITSGASSHSSTTQNPASQIKRSSQTAAHIFNPLSIPLNKYAIFFRMVVKRTAEMVAHWQANGFVHGMLSSNNLSILGLTLHHGPGGFLDSYDPEWTPNQFDTERQYCLKQQPIAVQWNLMRLGRVLSDLIGESHISSTSSAPICLPAGTTLEEALDNPSNGENIARKITQEFESFFIDSFTHLMCKKLGLMDPKPADMDELITPLLDIMAATGVDYTLFFRALSYFKCKDAAFSLLVAYEPFGRHREDMLDEAVRLWALVYRSRLMNEMATENLPSSVETAIDRVEAMDAFRMNKMKHINPKYTLRGWVLDEVVSKAEIECKMGADGSFSDRKILSNSVITPGVEAEPQKKLANAELKSPYSLPLTSNPLARENQGNSISNAPTILKECQVKEMLIFRV